MHSVPGVRRRRVSDPMKRIGTAALLLTGQACPIRYENARRKLNVVSGPQRAYTIRCIIDRHSRAFLSPPPCELAMTRCTAHVGVVGSARTIRFIHALIADERTVVAGVSAAPGPAQSDGERESDVLVIDRAAVRDVHRALRRYRRLAPTRLLAVINVQDERECIQLLDAGADEACIDGSAMLTSRLHAMSRRARATNADMRITFGNLVVDRERRRVWCEGKEIMLAPREYDVLIVLFHSAPEAVRKGALREAVWGSESAASDNAVEVYIGNLRRLFSECATVHIATVPIGGGYALAHGLEDAPFVRDDRVTRHRTNGKLQ